MSKHNVFRQGKDLGLQASHVSLRDSFRKVYCSHFDRRSGRTRHIRPNSFARAKVREIKRLFQSLRAGILHALPGDVAGESILLWTERCFPVVGGEALNFGERFRRYSCGMYFWRHTSSPIFMLFSSSTSTSSQRLFQKNLAVAGRALHQGIGFKLIDSASMGHGQRGNCR